MNSSVKIKNQGKRTFPTAIFVIVILAVCGGLAATSGYTFVTMSRLGDEYLDNLGRQVTRSVAIRIRDQSRSGGGSMRRRWRRQPLPPLEPQELESVLQEIVDDYDDKVEFILIVRGENNIMAKAGNVSGSVDEIPSGYTLYQGSRIYVCETPFPLRRHRHRRQSTQVTPPAGNPSLGDDGGQRGRLLRNRHADNSRGRVVIALRASAADFIMKQAHRSILMSGLSIVTMLVLSFYLIKTIRRFLALKAREESDRHLAALGTMAATLAHEIRNPLGAVKGLTQVVKGDLPDDHKSHSHLQTVISETERLEKLVTDLLTFAAPKEVINDTFDLVQLISEVKLLLESKLEKLGVVIQISADDTVIFINSDKNGIRQVLFNVLLNAIDMSPRDSSIRVTVNNDVRTKQVTMWIDDNGPGLGDRNPDDLFEPFITTKLVGTGLGLPISKQIIERVKGSIQLSNNNLSGARCTITLPVTNLA